MKKLAILSVVLALVISGCVQRIDFEDGPPTNVSGDIDTKTDIKSDIVENIERGIETTSRLQTSDENNVGSEGWCIPGSKIFIEGNEYVVVDIVRHRDRDNICKAEKIVQDKSYTAYYNEGYVTDGNNKFLEVISIGKNAEAKASVRVEG